VGDLSSRVFPDLRVLSVHGRMKPREKEARMAAFAQGECDIVVSTTVIEVGVDVPNAALMVVENAERYGLSQLHQLRGRVGRGQHKSYCVLFLQTEGENARQRLETLAQTNDGFKIAEADLKQRGPGDFFGSRQHGLPELKLASLSDDMDILRAAQAAAQDILARDPELAQPAHRALADRITRMFERAGGGFN